MVVYVAEASVDESRKRKGKLTKLTEKVNSKGNLVKSREAVYLNVLFTANELDSLNDYLESGNFSKSVAFVTTEVGFTYPSRLTEFYDKENISLQHRVPLEDFTSDLLTEIPEPVTILVDVSNDSNRDLRKYVELCNLSTRVRIIGGSLLKVQGLRVGLAEPGTLKGTAEKTENVVFPYDNGGYDNFQVVKLADLGELEETANKAPARKRVVRSLDDITKASRKKAEPKPKKLSKSAIKSSFLDTEEVDF